MKYAYTISFFLVTLLFFSGCSNENSTGYTESNTSVRKPITMPAHPKQETSGPMPGKNTPIEKTEDIIKKSEDTSAGNIEPETPEKQKGIYTVRKGDTLSAISEKKDVYNNRLKWTILYRDNKESFSEMTKGKDFYKTGLTPGLKLKFITDEVLKENLKVRSKKYYVANILSSPQMEKLTPMGLKLIENGFFTYITSTMVNNEEWYRLRAGFYRTRSEAIADGQKIKSVLGISDIWAAKIKDDEFEEFGGY